MSNNDYECFRCGYRTNKKSSILLHLNRMNKCNKRIYAMNYSDDECHNISLTKLKDRIKSELKCKHCSKVYSTAYVLDNHIKKYCKKYNNIDNENIDNENNTNENKSEDTKVVNNITNISNTSNNTNNTNNNIYIIQNINVTVPIPFDKDWNTEHIDNNLKQLIFLAENKYTNLLQKILENKNNLNVVMEKNANIGYIYNSQNEYKDMDKNDIIDISMKKLYNELNKIKDESTNFSIKVPEEFINNSVSKIENKYNDYISDNETKVNVQNCISNIFDNTKNDALDIFNNINEEGINGY